MRQPQPYKGKELVAPWADTWKEQIRVEAKERGLASYGTELETFNGRDALQDAMEEMHDAWMYVSQARRELMFKDTRIAELEAALRDVMVNPLCSYDDDYDWGCWYCHAVSQDSNQPEMEGDSDKLPPEFKHEDDCPYVRGQQLLGATND